MGRSDAERVVRKPAVVNLSFVTPSWNPVHGAVRIDRRTKWGNPFIIPRHGDRATVIAKYRDWIKTRPDLLAALHELRGKDLMCWCAPLACHGDVLIELCNEPLDGDNKSA